jgi:hypothetical protein
MTYPTSQTSSKDKKLVDIFPPTISYHFGKIYEDTSSRDSFFLGTPNLTIIAKCVESFKDELSIRGEWGVCESIDYHYELIDYSLKRLESYFKGDDSINEKDAYIYASFLSHQLKSIREIAKELDEQYESTP